MASRAIYKYDLGEPTPGVRNIALPDGAKLLSVGEQCGRLVCWAEVDPTAPLLSRRVAVVWTGHGEPPEDLPFVGTMQTGMGLVCHVYAQEAD